MRARTLLTTAVVALAACGSDGLSPTEVAGTYRLATIDGHALPHTDLPPGASAGHTVDAATLTLVADGSGTMTITRTWPSLPDVGTETGQWAVSWQPAQGSQQGRLTMTGGIHVQSFPMTADWQSVTVTSTPTLLFLEAGQWTFTRSSP